MVPSNQRNPIRVSHFQAEEEHEGFKGVEPPIDKVAHEEVVGVRDVAADAEELHEIVELAVDVAAYCDRGVDLYDVGFFDEELAGFVADLADLGFGNDAAGAEFGDGSRE